MEPVGFQEHNHAVCAASIMAIAESHCSANKLQFTPPRRRVLELLLEAHRALGAYDILQRLSDDGFKAQPAVAYRALDFLLAQGFVHKVERLNAFVACANPLEEHTPALMICRACGSVAEASLSLARGALGKAAREAGFRIERTVVEMEGLCPKCIAAGAA